MCRAISMSGTYNTVLKGPSLLKDFKTLVWFGHHYLWNWRHCCDWAINIYWT